MPKSGFLIINKPIGERSTRCVETVRRKLGKKVKAGHGGTLDSTASGVLVILIGAGTRLSNIVMGLPKCYTTTIQFGSETDTDDASGAVIRTADFSRINTEDIDSALFEFSGWRLQTPPNISAVHVDGKRAHELSRSGENVRIEAKPVYFEKVIRLSTLSADGQISFKIQCQKGTYIRSFGRDLARVLNSAGHVCRLEREFVGPFRIENAVSYSDIENMTADEIYKKLVTFEILSEVMPLYVGCEPAEKKLYSGQNIPFELLSRRSMGRTVNYFGKRVLLRTEKCFAVCGITSENGTVVLHPSVNLFLGE